MRRAFLVLVGLVLFVVARGQNVYATPYTFTTLAGFAGTNGGTKDGQGLDAQFYTPAGLVLDAAGNLFVVDTLGDTIRKVTPGGLVSTFAGKPGISGESDGTGTDARFKNAAGIAIDGGGTFYVTDANCVRKISPAGVVTTVAGSFTESGTADGVGPNARFYNLRGIAVDSSGTLYVADSGNNTIRRIGTDGNVTTLAGRPAYGGLSDGTGSAALFSGPTGIALNSAGDLFVLDTSNRLVRKVTSLGVVTTLAGSPSGLYGFADGTGSAAFFSSPRGLTIDSSGNLYVADTYNCMIRKVTPAGVASTIVGAPVAGGNGCVDGKAGEARFYDPEGVAIDSQGNIYVADTGNGVIRKVTPSLDVTTLAGTRPSAAAADGPGPKARFWHPDSLAVDPSGNIYVADTYNLTVRKVAPAGTVTTFAGQAQTWAGEGFQGNGTNILLDSGRSLPDAVLCVAVDGAGNVYAACSGIQPDIYSSDGYILKFDSNGNPTLLANLGGMAVPNGITVDSAGNVYVSATGESKLYKVTPQGVVSTFAGGPGGGSKDGVGTAAQFFEPGGLAIDGAGNLYVADTRNQQVRKVAPDGTVTTLAGQAGVNGNQDGKGSGALFTDPQGVAVDAAGNVYVAEWGNHQIRRISPDGTVTTVAGDGYVGMTDGTGPGALFHQPFGVAIDGNGNLYVADTVNNTIRKGSPAVSALPTITQQPASQRVDVGQFATLTIAATGWPLPLYQWQLNGVDVPGQTGASLMVIVTPATAGAYTVKVSNSLGTVVSDTAMLMQTAPNDDFNGDGQADLTWTNTTTGERRIWLLNGTQYGAEASLGLVDPEWTAVQVGNVAYSHRATIGWTNTQTGDRVLWLMNGATYGSSVDLGVVPLSWRLCGGGNFHFSGTCDLVWQNTETGEVVIWLMNGTAFSSSVSLGVVPRSWEVSGSGDFDGNYSPDILWTDTSTGERFIWLMYATTHTGDATLGVVPANLQISFVADYDGNGWPDLVMTNTATAERSIWLMNGATHIGTTSLGVIPLQWTLAGPPPRPIQLAKLDFNADGQADLLWENTATGEHYIWEMSGVNLASSVFVPAPGAPWRIATTGDFNADGQPDIVWENTATGERYVWLMNGTMFASSVNLGTVPSEWRIAATGDFNGDAQADLVWENTATGERYLWLMNGTNFASSVYLGTLPPEWRIADTGDFNGDGQPDLVWENTSTGERYVWLMNGTTFASSVFLGVVPPEWRIAAAADYNGDGQPDLVWQNTSTGERYVWIMSGTAPQSGVSLGVLPVEWMIRN